MEFIFSTSLQKSQMSSWSSPRLEANSILTFFLSIIPKMSLSPYRSLSTILDPSLISTLAYPGLVFSAFCDVFSSNFSGEVFDWNLNLR